MLEFFEQPIILSTNQMKYLTVFVNFLLLFFQDSVTLALPLILLIVHMPILSF